MKNTHTKSSAQQITNYFSLIKAGNLKEKSQKNLLYYLYPSKKLTKTVYNNLVNSFLKMETIFMSTENSKINKPCRFRVTLAHKLNLKDPDKNMALDKLSIHYTWKNIKSVYNSNRFEICAPTKNDAFDLSDEPYSVSDSPDYFEYIIKNARLWQINLFFIFIRIKCETGLFLK